MGKYVIAVGGTGNKILESVVYGACVDAFFEPDARGRKRPVDKLELLVVDVDAACGNTTRARQAAELYEQVRRAAAGVTRAYRGFHTELRVQRWSMNLSRRAASVDKMTENHRDDQLLARTLFSRTEAELEYAEGFRGHPDLGVLFFAELLGDLEDESKTSPDDEMLGMLRQIQGELERGESVKVMLVGSIFGGTGASGIPAISRFLRERFSRFNTLFEMGAVLMLPYYKVPPAAKNEEMEIVVKSSQFLDKARTALQYYGMESLIRSSEEDESGVYDALYLLGLPREAFVTTRMYSTGSQSQENDAHLLEWLAMRCVARFLRTSFRGEGRTNIDCYYYQMHTPTFTWESLDEEAESYRVGYGALLKACVALLTECEPVLAEHLRHPTGKTGAVGYCAAYLWHARDESQATRAQMSRTLEATGKLARFFCRWMTQVVATMPATLRPLLPREKDERQAAELYERLLALHALLQEQAKSDLPEVERREEAARRAAWESEYKQATAQLRALVQRLGQSAWWELLSEAQQSNRASLRAQRQAVAESAELLERMQGEDARRVTQEELMQQRQRGISLQKALETLEQRQEKIGSDVERVLRENGGKRAAGASKDEGIAENDLLDAKLMTRLLQLLTLLSVPEKERDERAVQQASTALKKGMNLLVRQRVPDRVDFARLMAATAGDGEHGERDEAQVAAFFTALLSAAMEEEHA